MIGGTIRLGFVTLCLSALCTSPLLAETPNPPTSVATRENAVAIYSADFFATWKPSTALDMVSRLPGFVFDAGASVRGFETGAGNVVVDGHRPTSKQDDLSAVLRRIPGSTVDHIELIREAGHGVDMDGHTLIANVVRKHATQDTIVLVGTYDETPRSGQGLPTARIELRHPTRIGVFDASILTQTYTNPSIAPGTHTQVDSPFDPSPINCQTICIDHLNTRVEGVITKPTVSYQGQIGGGLLNVNTDATLDQYSDRETDVGVPISHNDSLNFSYRGTAAEIGVNYTHDLGAQTSLEALAIGQTNQSETLDHFTSYEDQNLSTANRLSEAIIRAVLHHNFSSKLGFAVTAELADNIQNTANSYFVNAIPTTIPAQRIRVGEVRAQSDAVLTWALTQTFSIEAGVQLENSKITSRGDVTASKSIEYAKPRLVLNWTVDKDTQVKARAAREVGQLDFSAFVASGLLSTGIYAGNPTLLPEDKTLGEITFDRKFWGQGGLSLTAQHAEISNANDRIRGFDPTDPTDPSGYYDTPGNIGHARSDQLVAKLSAPLNRLGIANGFFSAQGTWRSVEVTDPTTGQTRQQSLVHPFDGTIHFDKTVFHGKLNWAVNITPPVNEVTYRYNRIDRTHYGTTLGVTLQYNQDQSSTWWLTLSDLTSRNVDRNYEVFLDSRPSAFSYYDDRVQSAGPNIRLRLRKLFH